MLSNPPLILLSFLPAPQQAILSVDLKASCIVLYGEDGAKSIFNDMQKDAEEETAADGSTSTIADKESDDEETYEDEDENEYDSEEDEYDSEEDEEWRDVSSIY